MMNRRSIVTPRTDPDPTMRPIEYAMAFVAIAVAAILAFVR
jgi:hypothetical protein